MDAFLLLALVYLVVAFALFWIIRLGVRYGTNDAMRTHRAWLTERDQHRGAADDRPAQ